jgi:hypothetical protein
MLTRRTAILTSAAAAICGPAHAASGAAPADGVYRGLATPSESVHSGVSSRDGLKRLTVRLCRYPELGMAWVWVHARLDGFLYSFVDHLAPCGKEETPADGATATYADLRETLVFTRRGPVDAPSGATVTGSCMARRTEESRFGPGAIRLDYSIVFTPRRLYSGLNPGRTEVFGVSRAVVRLKDRDHVIEGPAQFHEQRQSTPRFGAPFCYMSLWGEDASSTMLIGAQRRDGYLLEGDLPGAGKSIEVESVSLEKPGSPRRWMRVKLADGRSLDGRASVVESYTIPLMGNRWRGHMVRANLGGREFMGHINDYVIGAGVPYSI